MTLKTEKDYFKCEITRPINGMKKYLERLKQGDRFFLDNGEDLFIKSNQISEIGILCVSDKGLVEIINRKTKVIHVHGVAFTYRKLGWLIIKHVKNEGRLLFRTDLYP
ncbi:MULTISPECIES: hypothetical protein [unclassified Sphingobacterium]|uniref:hypothetical protein n=1 Tax=unclassified Sphingobacterium TaxID=2609468 RepID=UPI0025CE8E55|nr:MULTISPECIES: hypothetical protein [unclassified Sphingobacterium]